MTLTTRITRLGLVFGLWLGLASAAIAQPAVLVVEQGIVRVRPEGWFRAGWGWAVRGNESALESKDLLQPGPGSRAFVRCPTNPRTKTLIPNDRISSVNSLCNQAPILHRPPSSWSVVTGGMDAGIPYVITPRTGAVTEARPRLQWNPVEGATAYTVTLRILPDGESWTETSTEASLDYPAGWEPLKEDTPYRLEVETDTGVSSLADEAVQFSFSPEEPEELQALAGLELPAGIEAGERVRLYLEAKMRTAALAVLQGWEPEPGEVAVRQWWLGEVYGALSLRLLAAEAYQAAWNGAVLPGDLGIATEAAMALGTLYEEEPEVAVQWWRRAELGAAYGCDLEKLEEIWGQLEGLEDGFEQPTEEEDSCRGQGEREDGGV